MVRVGVLLFVVCGARYRAENTFLKGFAMNMLQKRCINWLLVGFTVFGLQQPVTAQTVGTVLQVTSTRGEDGGAFKFGFDRIFVSVRSNINDYASYKVMVDFNKQFNKRSVERPKWDDTKSDSANVVNMLDKLERNFVDPKDGETSTFLKDAFIAFKLPEYAQWGLSVGKFKTPAGMEFAAPAPKLDFVKRGLGQGLVFDRNPGLMVQGTDLSPWGLHVALGLFNAGPNKANGIGSSAEGDYTVVSRIGADPSKQLHAQAYWGRAMTSVAGQGAVQLMGIGSRFNVGSFIVLKGEYMLRDDPNNAAADGFNAYVQGTYQVRPRLQAALKWDALDVAKDEQDRTDLTIGLSLFSDAKKPQAAKVQINYVASDAKGKDAIQLLFQAAM